MAQAKNVDRWTTPLEHSHAVWKKDHTEDSAFTLYDSHLPFTKCQKGVYIYDPPRLAGTQTCHSLELMGWAKFAA